MQDCNHELNKQIKGIQARLSQAENNISSHFVGTSTLVIAMLANPFTAPSAASVSAIYNLAPGGFDAMQKLIQQISAIDMKALMMQGAAALEDAMAAELDALVGMVNDSIDAAITAAEQTVDASIAAVEAATIALQDAVASDIQSAIDTAQGVLDAAVATADSAAAALSSLLDIKISAPSMIKAQADAAKCNSVGLVINS